MTSRTLRHIASIVLLAVYLPMVVGASLHVHHETVDTHDSCLQCAGHYDTHHHHRQDCQYCHFLGLDYLGKADGQSKVILPATERCAAVVAEQVVLPVSGVSRLRAPPTGSVI